MRRVFQSQQIMEYLPNQLEQYFVVSRGFIGSRNDQSVCVVCANPLSLYIYSCICKLLCNLRTYSRSSTEKISHRKLEETACSIQGGGGAVKEDGLRCTGPFAQNVTDVFHKLAGLGLL